MKKKHFKINTRCIHAGTYTDPKGLGINTPIFASTAHLFPNAPGEIIYPRHLNTLTQTAVAEKICALEGGQAGLVMSSGMAAISTVLAAFLKKGDHAIFHNVLYGGTQEFINTELAKHGIQFDIISSNQVNDFAHSIKKNTALIYLESPTNPLLDVIDLKSLARIAQKHGVLTVVDNTFATPINQNPLQLGIDIVVHSGTKYLNGHSDLLCGAIVTSAQLIKPISYCATIYGGTLDVLACYLLERGLKTLGVRMAQHNKNAQTLAEILNQHPLVKKVFYPGLPTHPGYEIACQQMKGFGGMLSFELNCNAKLARKFVNSLEIITPAISLGSVESLVCFPSETSHAKLSSKQRQKQGISNSLIRLSVGIEDIEDLINDIARALAAIKKKNKSGDTLPNYLK